MYSIIYTQEKKLVEINYAHDPELICVRFFTGEARFHGSTAKPDSRMPLALRKVFSLLQQSRNKVADRSILELDLSHINISDEHIKDLIVLLQKLSVYQCENPQLAFRLSFQSNDCLTEKGICFLLNNLKYLPENLQISGLCVSNITFQTLANVIIKGEAKKGLSISFQDSFSGKITDNGLIALANGIASGLAPENFSISLWCSEIKTCASADAIAKVVAMGKAPKGFGFSIGYTLSSSKEDLGKVLLSFADAIKTGKAPEGFSLDLHFSKLEFSYFKKFMNVLCDGKAPKSFAFDISSFISTDNKNYIDNYIDQICRFLESGRVPVDCRIGLQRKRIGDEGFIKIMQAIKKGVKKGNQLQGLQLILGDINNPPADNLITDKGIKYLADLIKKNLFPQNFFLNLSGNIMTNDGAHALLDALENQRSLKGLNIVFDHMQPLVVDFVDYTSNYVDKKNLIEIEERLKAAKVAEFAFAYLLLVRHFSKGPNILPLDVLQKIIFYAFPFKNTLKFDAHIFTNNIIIKAREFNDIKCLSNGKAPRNLRIAFPHMNDEGLAYLALAIQHGEKVGNRLQGLMINLSGNQFITDAGFSALAALIINKFIPYQCTIDLRHTKLTNKSAEMLLIALNMHGYFNDFQILLDGTSISSAKIARINDFIDAHRSINQAAVLCIAAYNKQNSPLGCLSYEILKNIFQFVFPFADKLNSKNQSSHLTFFKNVMMASQLPRIAPQLSSNDNKLDDNKHKCIIS